MNRKYRYGFSLIEMLIVVALVGILSALAYSSYKSQTDRTRRTETQGAMSALAASLEGWRAQNFSYNGATVAALSPELDTSEFYEVELVLSNNDMSYEIRATPKNTMVGTGHMRLDNRGRSCFDRSSDSSCDLADPDQSWSR